LLHRANGIFQVVDAEHWDETVFPLFSQARHLDCVLNAGEALFIPKGWWHYVRALDDSISVSCWFGQ
jgi:ribosomal protein L16 Arg81 hydroxylase